MEFSKLVQRLLITNLKVIIAIAALVLLVCYIKSVHHTLSPEQNWSISGNHFDDNLDKIRLDLQYAVIVDAGSSGSRVYIYVWPPHSGDTRQLLKIRLLHDNGGKDVFHSITPGLSSCSSHPENASDYIIPLLKFAAENIPKTKHKETPLYILATAGMRLLSKSQQDLILDDLRKDIPKEFSFLFTPGNVQVISGKEEGIYSWVSINYLMGRFDHSLAKSPLVEVEMEKDQKRLKRMNTISMMEMGGASTQIAFEITSTEQYNSLKAVFQGDSFKEMVSTFNLGCTEHDTNHQYRLFVTTYLTLGANAARRTYTQHLIDNWTEHNYVNTSLNTLETVLFDPCLSIDSSEMVNITRPSQLLNNGSTQFIYHLKGSGDFNGCLQKVKQIVTFDGLKWCNNGTCPFQDLHKVSVPFIDTEFYGLSEFWYSMNDIFAMGGLYSSTKFSSASSKYCSTSWLVTQDRFRRKLYPNADSKRLLHQCFKSAWMTSILHDGFKMPTSYSHFTSVSLLNNEPVQWTLGALIFRTRFFPLRTLDNQHGVQVQHVVNSSTGYNYLEFLAFVICMTAVIFCIIVYLKRLHMMVNTTSYFPLKTNDIENYQDNDHHAASVQSEHKNVFINMNFSWASSNWVLSSQVPHLFPVKPLLILLLFVNLKDWQTSLL